VLIPRILWIDALCIDQHDAVERNLQVSRMDSIFRSATKLIIHLDLGLHYQGSTALLKGISAKRRPEYLADGEMLIEKELPLLLKRPWFSRVWVLQEVLLSRDALLVCGNEQCSWRTLQ